MSSIVGQVIIISLINCHVQWTYVHNHSIKSFQRRNHSNSEWFRTPAQIINLFRRPPAWQSRKSTCKQRHSTCSRWRFQFSHDTTCTIEIQHTRRYENVTDCCSHSYSYSYKMILITISFSYRSFPHLGCCTSCIHCWTCPHLCYHRLSDKWLSPLLFAPGKVGVRVIINRGTSVLHHCGLPLEKMVPISSFARWNHCPLPQRTCVACFYVHCWLVYITAVT